jgi:hypothetical protein
MTLRASVREALEWGRREARNQTAIAIFISAFPRAPRRVDSLRSPSPFTTLADDRPSFPYNAHDFTLARSRLFRFFSGFCLPPPPLNERSILIHIK